MSEPQRVRARRVGLLLLVIGIGLAGQVALRGVSL